MLNTAIALVVSKSSVFLTLQRATRRGITDFTWLSHLLDVMEDQMNGDEAAFVEGFSEYVAVYNPDVKPK